MTLLNRIGENRRPEKGTPPSDHASMSQTAHVCETTRLRERAAKRLGTICTMIGQRVVRRPRLMTGSNGN